jgi:hypothetical protein
VLLDDSPRYLERAVAAGADAKLDLCMGMPHGFVTDVGGFNAATQAQCKPSIPDRAAGENGQMKTSIKNARGASGCGNRRPPWS